MTATLKIRDQQSSFNEATGTRESWSDEIYTVKAVPPSIAKNVFATFS